MYLNTLLHIGYLQKLYETVRVFDITFSFASSSSIRRYPHSLLHTSTSFKHTIFSLIIKITLEILSDRNRAPLK